jgi:hypothetical protein
MKRITLDLLGSPVNRTHYNPTSGWTLATGAGIPCSPPGKLFFRRMDKGLNDNAAYNWSETSSCGSSGSDLEEITACKSFGHNR